jgi:hypothetical protein
LAHSASPPAATVPAFLPEHKQKPKTKNEPTTTK